MKRLLLLTLFCFPLTASAGSGPLFMKDLLGDREFFNTWGIGVDYFTMDQSYDIKALEFALPGVVLPDASQIAVDNEISHFDVKLDVWLTPFLQVYGLVGRVDANTVVDLSAAQIFGLPVSLGELPVSYDGTVYGGGAVLVYGTERWFASVNTTYTKTSLGGDFDSSVDSLSVQPRVGLVHGKFNAFVGAMYLHTDETHSGAFALPIPGLPPVPFNVELESSNKWNTVVGLGAVFSPAGTLNVEYGFGKRDHFLINFAYRF